jgi:hypothetical protein
MRIGVPSCLLAAALAGGCIQDSQTPAEPESFVVPVFAQTPGEKKNFRTHANGAEEVPVRDTEAQGQAIFQINDAGTEISYKLIVANIENVTQAHIHLGPPGVSGGIVVWLYPSAPPQLLIPGRSDGTLNEGVIRNANVMGTLLGQGVAGLLTQIRAGNAYVNVHTSQFPPGEIRGQID